MYNRKLTITVKTGNVILASTDANVYIKIFGSNGNTSEIALNETSLGQDLFEGNQEDTFDVYTNQDVGIVKKIFSF